MTVKELIEKLQEMEKSGLIRFTDKLYFPDEDAFPDDAHDEDAPDSMQRIMEVIRLSPDIVLLT
jgi:hypothetical protein